MNHFMDVKYKVAAWLVHHKEGLREDLMESFDEPTTEIKKHVPKDILDGWMTESALAELTRRVLAAHPDLNYEQVSEVMDEHLVEQVLGRTFFSFD